MAIALGPFQLEAPIGHGGMGVVWSGHHTAHGTPVAVKVLATPDPRMSGALNREVQAVAGLDHPHIIWVHDVGVVDAQAATVSKGELVEGTPWFAMERCDGGTATDGMTSLSWPVLRQWLLELLGAHAHAHGVVHRDLKPANILFGGERPGLKLTDFGMVLRRDVRPDGTMGLGRTAGTPRWMAPEQFAGAFADQGPWTDLYALGCVAFALVTGRPPFLDTDAAALRQAHLSRPPPALRPRLSVPEGLEQWIAALLDKDPHSRLGHAADAAHGLRLIDRSVSEVGATQAATLADEPTRVLSEMSTTWLPPSPPTAGPTGRALRRSRPPPADPSWRADVPGRPLRLVGAGLGLFGVRHPARRPGRAPVP